MTENIKVENFKPSSNVYNDKRKKKICRRCSQSLHSSQSRASGYCTECESKARFDEKMRFIKEKNENRRKAKLEYWRNRRAQDKAKKEAVEDGQQVP